MCGMRMAFLGMTSIRICASEAPGPHGELKLERRPVNRTELIYHLKRSAVLNKHDGCQPHELTAHTARACDVRGCVSWADSYLVVRRMPA